MVTLRTEDDKRRPWMWTVAGLLGGSLWLSFCAWMFAFSYSDSYFKYSPCSWIAVFAAALIGSTAIPLGAILVWRRFNSALGRIIGQVAVAILAQLPLAATSFLLARIPGACHLSGDDAMGAGIDLLLLTGIAAFSVVGLAMAAMVRAGKGRHR